MLGQALRSPGRVEVPTSRWGWRSLHLPRQRPGLVYLHELRRAVGQMTEPRLQESVSAWLSRKAEYTSSLSMSGVRAMMDEGNLAGVLRELARLAAREER